MATTLRLIKVPQHTDLLWSSLEIRPRLSSSSGDIFALTAMLVAHHGRPRTRKKVVNTRQRPTDVFSIPRFYNRATLLITKRQKPPGRYLQLVSSFWTQPQQQQQQTTTFRPGLPWSFQAVYIAWSAGDGVESNANVRTVKDKCSYSTRHLSEPSHNSPCAALFSLFLSST